MGGTPGARPQWASSGGDVGAERPVPAEVVARGGSSPAPSFNAARVPLPAATPAGPAAAGSSDARARAARAAEARALGLASGAGHEPPTAGAVAAAAAGLLSTGNARSEAPPRACASSWRWGFAKTQRPRRVALRSAALLALRCCAASCATRSPRAFFRRIAPCAQPRRTRSRGAACAWLDCAVVSRGLVML